MTAIGDILDEFFSPFSDPTLWVMPESDQYTRRVRAWPPVVEAVARIKNRLRGNCSGWASLYKTNPSWVPVMSDTPKSGADREFVKSPPGTDPDTCKSAFILYMASKGIGILVPTLSEVQTNNLYTCSIGSFNIYTTVDEVDCAAKTATMNFWMYNAMSKTSFGKFANHAAFSLSGMKTQYMWWNWVEKVEWTTGAVNTVKPSSSGSGWG